MSTCAHAHTHGCPDKHSSIVYVEIEVQSHYPTVLDCVSLELRVKACVGVHQAAGRSRCPAGRWGIPRFTAGVGLPVGVQKAIGVCIGVQS